MPNKRPHRLLGSSWKYCIPTLIVLVLELFVFNYPALESFTFPGTQTATFSTGNGISHENDTYTVTSNDGAYIEVAIPQPETIDNIFLPIRSAGEPPRFKAGKTYFISPSVLDEGNSTYPISLGEAHVSEGIPATHYIRLHPAGKVSSLHLNIKNAVGESFHLDSIEINTRVPFFFSPIRIALALLIAYTLYYFSPTRPFNKAPLNLSDRSQRISLLTFLTLQSLILVVITQLIQPAHIFASSYLTENGAFINDDNQYNHVANAILTGHTYLDLPVPDWMSTLTNPYDAGHRAQLSLQTGQPTYWDYAFYNGHYYSYFGVLPALLTFVPYKFLTGLDLRTDYAVAFFAVLFVFSAAFFLHRVITKYFNRTTFGFFTSALLMFITGSSVLTQTFLPKIYSLPLLVSLCLTLTGLGLWLSARRTDGSLSKISLVLGAFLISANLGARPQFILATFLAFPIFWDEIKEKLFFSRQGLSNTLCIFLPFIASISATTIYNYARFASLTNFGATYNLTGFDMVHRSYALSRIPWGIWFYLFQPIKLHSTYPFMSQVTPSSHFMGQTIMEPFYGGFFIFTPAALLLFWGFFTRKFAHKPHWNSFNLGILLFAGLLVILDTEVVGISSRYFGDFGWLLLTSAIGTTILLLDRYANEGLGTLVRHIFTYLILAGVFLSYWNLLADERYGALIAHNNTIYRTIESWLLFLS